MSRVDQEAVTTFAEVLSTAGVSYHQQSRQVITDKRPVIHFQGLRSTSQTVWFPAGDAPEDAPEAAPGDDTAMMRQYGHRVRPDLPSLWGHGLSKTANMPDRYGQPRVQAGPL